ncbi:disease resistance protein [Hirschfeldia incana]|nr:disease resistance protein [Hirschfeldia incana]
MSEMIGGAVVSEGLKQLIAEANKFKNFKPLSKELISTMKRLVPLTEKIDSLQNKLNPDDGELKELLESIERAKIVVHKCRRVPCWKRSKRTREIEQVNNDMLKYCQIDIQLLMFRNQLQFMEANNNNFKKLCSVPELKKDPVGFALPLMMLKQKVFDAAVVRLVVSAPPGCGKTMLVTHLCHDQEIQTKFKHIFYSVVSSTPNFRVIVQRLIEHNGYQSPAFDNDTQAGIGLKMLLKKLEGKDILLVLDDVWSGAESFLENLPTDIPNLKILLTSRFDSLDFGDTFKLEPLKKEDARTLLIECASRPDQASNDEYELLLQKILERCAGFPLLIKVIGGSLNRKKSLTQWKGQVVSWSTGRSVLENPSTTVYDGLKPSFNALDSDLKECFLDMGLFLEDQKIRAWVITDIWAELYGTDGITEKEKTILSLKYLEDLASHNLLDLASLGKKEHEDGFYNDFLVTQHDILRELAIRQNKSEGNLDRKRLTLEIKEDGFPDWCLDSVHPVVNASMLCIFTDNAFSSTWFEMDCPNVEALVLNISSSNYALPSFISTMKKLKIWCW